MKKFMKIFLIVFAVAVLAVFLAMWNNRLIILPTNSSPQMLTLVKYGYPRPKKIIMRHYVNDVAVNEYVLELKRDLRSQQPQKYKLPEVSDGRAEINVEMEDGVTYNNNITLTLNCDSARDLYDRGLLIYLATDYASGTEINGYVYYDQYAYFISGQEKIYYAEKAGDSNWQRITDAPQLKKFTQAETGYSPHPNDLWKENGWKKIGTKGDVHVLSTF